MNEGNGVATTTRELTFSQAINDALRLAMRRDPTVIVMGSGAYLKFSLGFQPVSSASTITSAMNSWECSMSTR